MAEVEYVLVPDDLGVYEVPTCELCGTPFVHRVTYGSTQWWRQGCVCLVTEKVSSSVYEPEDKRSWRETTFDGDLIGKPKYHRCTICWKPLTPGEETLHVETHSGYVHPDCYRAEQEGIRQAEEEEALAKQGPSISFWFARDVIRLAPNTGHYDNERRMIPRALPELPAGAVTYEMYTRPFAMSYMCIPSLEDAEAFWQAAQTDPDVPYEMHWYEPGATGQKATRSWKGKGFSQVEADARRAEWDAERGYTY